MKWIVIFVLFDFWCFQSVGAQPSYYFANMHTNDCYLEVEVLGQGMNAQVSLVRPLGTTEGLALKSIWADNSAEEAYLVGRYQKALDLCAADPCPDSLLLPRNLAPYGFFAPEGPEIRNCAKLLTPEVVKPGFLMPVAQPLDEYATGIQQLSSDQVIPYLKSLRRLLIDTEVLLSYLERKDAKLVDIKLDNLLVVDDRLVIADLDGLVVGAEPAKIYNLENVSPEFRRTGVATNASDRFAFGLTYLALLSESYQLGDLFIASFPDITQETEAGALAILQRAFESSQFLSNYYNYICDQITVAFAEIEAKVDHPTESLEYRQAAALLTDAELRIRNLLRLPLGTGIVESVEAITPELASSLEGLKQER